MVEDSSSTQKKTNHWYVITPEYTNYYQDEPPETQPDVVCVEADTKREALVIGVRELRKLRNGWMSDVASDRTNPFTGLKAQRAECPHGNCWCDICTAKPNWFECPQCMAQWEQEEKEELERQQKEYDGRLAER